MPEKRDHGPLPGLLIVLTAVTGLVDAVTYLQFGNVFVANMTGNVIFLGFRLGGSGEGTGALLATTISTVFFCVGAVLGGRLAFRGIVHRGLLLSAGAAAQACVVAAAAVFVTLAGHTAAYERRVLIPLLAASMGWQFAIVRRIGVPGLRTVVITTTLTSLVADPGQPRRQFVHKALSVAALLVGAMAGPLLIRHIAVAAPLWLSAALLLALAAAGVVTARYEGSETWGRPT